MGKTVAMMSANSWLVRMSKKRVFASPSPVKRVRAGTQVAGQLLPSFRILHRARAWGIKVMRSWNNRGRMSDRRSVFEGSIFKGLAMSTKSIPGTPVIPQLSKSCLIFRLDDPF